MNRLAEHNSMFLQDGRGYSCVGDYIIYVNVLALQMHQLRGIAGKFVDTSAIRKSNALLKKRRGTRLKFSANENGFICSTGHQRTRGQFAQICILQLDTHNKIVLISKDHMWNNSEALIKLVTII